MNLNLFRYLGQLVGDSATSFRSLHEHQCKCLEQSSTYNRQKETKNDVYLQNENSVGNWISLSLNKKSFGALEHIEMNEKLKLPYEGRQLFTRWTHSYPNSNEIKSKTFYIKYNNELSVVDKIMLNNFQNKYFYHIIDDIIYSLKSKNVEQDNLLTILYSPVLYLQNNFSIDFFDIWVDEIYINQQSKVNKFLAKNNSNLEPFSYITIKFLYTTKLPVKKPEPLW
jgi:hypothetical protein|uniref:hypothetical protein n=1 Tax=Pseudo-nitzschia americana TaxID=44446 RepID=UPI001D10FE1D|nr:hypothetical protein LK284_pgp113 [Pseudo-nitzschia americana]UBA15016.1 hypothetical protein [Pseudo-nitzschia americana]